MNIFRTPKWDAKSKEWVRPLDLKFLRVCSVYRLLKAKKITRDRAFDLLAERHSKSEMKILRGTVDLWLDNFPRLSRASSDTPSILEKVST